MSIRISEDRVIHDTETSLEVCATDIRASEINPRIGARKRVVIHADTLRLDSPILAPGADITLIARKVLTGPQATVNVSGVDGADAPQVRPPPQLDAAATPENGRDGENGGHAGSIHLLFKELDGPLALQAKGGMGGLAQPGADGANGKHGQPHQQKHQPGGAGGDAGQPGRAGQPGTAGDGGSILAYIDQGIEKLSTDTSGGKKAPAASHGQPGTPGLGGAGGEYWECYELDTGETRPPRIRCDRLGNHPDGPDGRPAAPIDDPAPAGMGGADGQVALGDVFAHSIALPPRGLKFLGIHADIRHIKGDEEAAAIAAWLFAISSRVGDASVADGKMRVAATLGRISAGLPPIGIQGTYCSMRPIGFHIDSLRQLLESRARVQFYLSEMRDEHVQADTVRGSIEEITTQAGVVASLGAARQKAINSRLLEAAQQLSAIKETYWAVWFEVQESDKAFREAVAKRNPCGDFLNAVIGVTMVAVTIASGGATVASFAAGGAEAFQWLSKDAETKKQLGEFIAGANAIKTRLDGYAKDAEGVRAAAERAKEFLGGDGQNPPSDQVKVSMSREDFNRMIEPYKDIAEAQNLRTLMDKFFSMTETRNSLLLEHTQLIVELAAARAEVATAQRHRDELERLQGSALLTRIADVYEAALWADLEVGRRHLAALADANSAFVYEWLADRPVDLSSTRRDHIEHQFSAMLDDRRRVPVDNSLASVCEFTISPASHKEVFTQLQGERAQISLMPSNVDDAQTNRWDERAFSVGIRLVFEPAYKPKVAIECKAMLTSMGLSWFKAESGQLVVMKVPRRGATLTARKTLDLDLIQEERNLLDARTEIVEMSPFGIWSMYLPGISQHLEHLRELQIVFVGTARHSAEVRVALRRYGEALLADRTQAAPALAGQRSLPPAPVLPFDLNADDAKFKGPYGESIRDAVKLRLLEECLFAQESVGGGDIRI